MEVGIRTRTCMYLLLLGDIQISPNLIDLRSHTPLDERTLIAPPSLVPTQTTQTPHPRINPRIPPAWNTPPHRRVITIDIGTMSMSMSMGMGMGEGERLEFSEEVVPQT